jgi:hypothetical protein
MRKKKKSTVARIQVPMGKETLICTIEPEYVGILLLSLRGNYGNRFQYATVTMPNGSSFTFNPKSLN